jgi:serine/tyrosine/threonine adenylyltransferase
LNASHADWTRFWRRLSRLRTDATTPAEDSEVRDLVIDRAAFDAWAVRYRERLRAEHSDDRSGARGWIASTRSTCCAITWRKWRSARHAATTATRDFSEVSRLLKVLERPYDEQPEFEAYAEEPPDWARTLELSCSS